MEFAGNCKFNDCFHMNEIGCAVLEALKNEKIGTGAYNNLLKMENEKKYCESTRIEKHQRDKAFGKMIKNDKKDKKLNKY